MLLIALPTLPFGQGSPSVTGPQSFLLCHSKNSFGSQRGNEFQVEAYFYHGGEQAVNYLEIT